MPKETIKSKVQKDKHKYDMLVSLVFAFQPYESP